MKKPMQAIDQKRIMSMKTPPKNLHEKKKQGGGSPRKKPESPPLEIQSPPKPAENPRDLNSLDDFLTSFKGALNHLKNVSSSPP